MIGQQHSSRLTDLFRSLPEIGLEDAAEYIDRITHDRAFMTAQIIPLLTRIAHAQGPSIALSYGTREASTCLQVFAWPAGAATPIHDHTSWGAYHCVIGSLVEQRYERIDDGEQPSTARLRKAWQRTWRSEDGTSTVLPYEKGIHQITNPNAYPAISIHLYGRRSGVFDGRDYDPRRDFVCDRLEFDRVVPLPRRDLIVV